MFRPYVFLCGIVLTVVAAAPLAALDFTPPARHHFDLFEPLPVKEIDDVSKPRAEPEPEPEPRPVRRSASSRPHDRDHRPHMDDWNSRGFGLAVVATGAIALPGAGIGFEFSVPVDPYISLTARTGMIGGVFFEGAYFDWGVRGYMDVNPRFTLYCGLGFRVLSGRILDYVGGDLNDPLYRAGFGGYTDLGMEIGSNRIRFFFEITLNGAKLFDTDYQIGFFCGFNFGLRIYVG